jgi:enoyl-CoA hydratase/carnithine racemase
VGLRQAKRIALLNERIEPDEAVELGLATEAVASARSMTACIFYNTVLNPVLSTYVQKHNKMLLGNISVIKTTVLRMIVRL